MNRTDFIKKQIYGIILDIGHESGSLHELIFNKNVYGLDLYVKKYKKNSVKGDAQYMPFKNKSFDSLIAGEVIEHLIEPNKFLKECKRVLKNNGLIIISTPNKKSLINRIFKSSFHKWHVSLFDVDSIKEIISNYFIIEKIFCSYYDSVSSWGSKHKRLYKFRKFIHYFLPKNFQENIIILGRNIEK